MSRVFYIRQITRPQLESYETLGWRCVGGKTYALDELSLMVEWTGAGEPVEPGDITTRSAITWSLSSWDCLLIVLYGIAGFFWGVCDWIRGRLWKR